MTVFLFLFDMRLSLLPVIYFVLLTKRSAKKCCVRGQNPKSQEEAVERKVVGGLGTAVPVLKSFHLEEPPPVTRQLSP